MGKKFFLILCFISIVAFVMRLSVAHELVKFDSQVSSPSTVTDMFTYKDVSEKILKGEFEKEFYYQPFYYAVFLPGIKLIFGNGIWAVLIIQCILSAFTVFLSGLSASMLRSRKAGVVTALLLTFSTMLIMYSSYYLIATLQAFWISLIFYLCLRYICKFRFHSGEMFAYRCIYSSIIGGVVGISILTRGNVWFFVPGIIAMIMILENKKHNIWKKLLPVMILILFIIIPQIPFSYHNTKIKGEFTGPSTAAGAVLLLGNTPESPPGGREAGTGAGAMEYPETCKSWAKQAKDEKTPVYLNIMNWFAREPLAFIELQLRKMLLFWDYREIPNNISIENNGLKSSILRWCGLIPVWSNINQFGKFNFVTFDFIPMSFIILGFGLSGFLMLFFNSFSRKLSGIPKKIKSHLSEYLLFYFIFAYWLGTSAFYILARFRVPIIPLLAIFAAVTLCRLYNFIIKRKNKKLSVCIILICSFSFIFVLFGYSFYRYGLESKVMKIVRPKGVQVNLDEKILMIKDNGPMSFGGWNFIGVKKKIDMFAIEKEFVIPEGNLKNYSATLVITLYWASPGKGRLIINGVGHFVSNATSGFKTHEFELQNNCKNNFLISPENMEGVYFIIDNQRDYGRTKLNGHNFGGELVSSLYLKKKSPK